MSKIFSEMRQHTAQELGNEVWKLDKLMEVIKLNQRQKAVKGPE